MKTTTDIVTDAILLFVIMKVKKLFLKIIKQQLALKMVIQVTSIVLSVMNLLERVQKLISSATRMKTKIMLAIMVVLYIRVNTLTATKTTSAITAV